MDFAEFPKMPRLNREVIVTEKIDGTNACIGIEECEGTDAPGALCVVDGLALFVGSRSRWLSAADDNFGFARWALAHRDELLTLGAGRHFGEWWGGGIQRSYGLAKDDKRLSLFNVQRWALHGTTPAEIPSSDPRVPPKTQDPLPPCVGLVPVLYRGPFQTAAIEGQATNLRIDGSLASPGFMRPEGLVVFHIAGNVGFKMTLERDDEPKGRR